MKRSLLAMLLIVPVSTAAPALVVNIDYKDNNTPSLEEGFFDLTLGAARRAAFERALEIWTTQLDGTVELEINAQFNSLASINILGAAGTESYSANLSGLGNVVWYPAALASQLHGSSLPAIDGPFLGFHMSAEFNSDRDTLALGAGRWYYGLDGNPPGTDKDFVTVALHELGHAFGFGPLVNFSTGAWAFPFPKDFPDIFSKTANPHTGPVRRSA